MSLDLSPRPGAAPFAAMVRAQAWMETKLIARNGEQLLLAVVIPILALLGSVFGASKLGLSLSHRPIDLFAPGVIALAVLSTSFTSVAITTGFERRYGVLKRLGTSPLPRSGLLLAKASAVFLIELAQIALISVVAIGLGWRPDLGGVLPALVAIVLGTVAFAALGLLIAGTLRAEATLAAANLVFLLLMVGGAVVLPASTYGSGFAEFASWLPSGALGEALRRALIDGAWSAHSGIVLTTWALIAGALTARTFKWE